MNDLGINDFLVLLGTDGQGIRHQVVDESGVPLRETVDCSKSRRFNDS